jgi:transcriptional regulator with XRE-family HTH domain
MTRGAWAAPGETPRMWAVADNIYRILALRVREERRRAGLTLEQLGERAGITGAFVAHIEAGRKRPTLDTVQKLAEALGLAPAALIADDSGDRGSDAAYVRQFARFIRPMKAAQKDALLKLMRAGADLAGGR